MKQHIRITICDKERQQIVQRSLALAPPTPCRPGKALSIIVNPMNIRSKTDGLRIAEERFGPQRNNQIQHILRTRT